MKNANAMKNGTFCMHVSTCTKCYTLPVIRWAPHILAEKGA